LLYARIAEIRGGLSEMEFIRLYKTTEAEMHSRKEAYGNQKWYTRYWKYVLKDGFFVKIEALCWG
jgi:hypothetical protein